MATRRPTNRIVTAFFAALALGGLLVGAAGAQELGGAGTIQGTVKDPTGGVMQSVEVRISNPVSGFNRTVTTDAMGKYIARNVPQNRYHVSVAAQGFQTVERDVEVRTAVPIDLDLTLSLAGTTAVVEVIGHADVLAENDPTAHTDIDQTLVEKLPLEASSGLNQVVTLATPGVVADANGFFHPIGDHAQAQFSIDNQPVTDQQSRLYSNQISPEAVQSMEAETGVPQAEFGQKTSLVVRIVTKSGIDQPKPTGSVNFGYGWLKNAGADTDKTPRGDVNIGGGNHRVGDFMSFSGLRSHRFLDPPEFVALHDRGDNESFFNRLDLHPNDVDALHLNVQLARSSFAVPNTFDQADAGQDQHQKVTTVNFAPGYTRVVSSKALLTANLFVRRDHVTYTPSADPFADESGTVSQDRTLTNIGGKVDFTYAQGTHNVKFGATIMGTKLDENFTLGVTDPTINSPCVDSNGDPSDNTRLRTPSQCAASRLRPNPDFVPGLLPYDLTRAGRPFQFLGNGTVKEQGFYIQGEIRAGNATFKLGLRADHYDGFSSATLVQPRLGASVLIPGSGTIFRASYGRTQETPYNENLVLSSSIDAAVFGTGGEALPTGKRDHVEAGLQQGFGNWVVADFSYYYKRTTNGYDFGELFSTPIFFPVSWNRSKIYGVAGRINVVQHDGFSAFTVLGTTNSIFSPPGTGGLLLSEPTGDFRIDHDQKFQQTTNVQYVFSQPVGAWVALSWRYDSGLVAGSVPDYATALTLTADQQAAIGLFCGGTVATLDAPITKCASSDRGAKRLVIPADGTEDDVENPPRIAPRHLFDLGFGLDNLLNTSRAKMRLRFSIVNLTNKEALYNFLSTFSGTHFVTPRAYQVQLGVTF